MTTRRMIVTVGASMFHSASWLNEGPLRSIEGYSEWLDDYYLDRPSRRLATVAGDRGEVTGAFINDELKRHLTIENISEYTWHMAQDTDHPLRYSAELSTILKLHRSEANPDITLGSYLIGAYDSIVFLCACSDQDPSHIAAHHLRAQLRMLAPSVHERIRVSAEIEGDRLEKKTESFAHHLDSLARLQPNCDLILSGGYKAYGIRAAVFAVQHPECRIIYVHEDDEDPQLVVFDSGGYLRGPHL